MISVDLKYNSEDSFNLEVHPKSTTNSDLRIMIQKPRGNIGNNFGYIHLIQRKMNTSPRINPY